MSPETQIFPQSVPLPGYDLRREENANDKFISGRINTPEISKKSGELPNLVREIKEDLLAFVKITETTSKASETAQDVYATLDQLTDGKFLSVEAMNESLKGLSGVNVEIPEDEILRMKSLFPQEISPENQAKLNQLKSVTEGEKSPLMMQIPTKVVLDGAEKDFNIALMQEILSKASATDNSLKPLYLTHYIPRGEQKTNNQNLDETGENQPQKDLLKQTWSSELKAWSTAFLKGSTGLHYLSQIKHQTMTLEPGCEVEADIILAMALQYIATREEFFRNKVLRLNERGLDKLPLCVSSNKKHLVLNFVNSDASSYVGTGGCVRIPA